MWPRPGCEPFICGMIIAVQPLRGAFVKYRVSLRMDIHGMLIEKRGKIEFSLRSLMVLFAFFCFQGCGNLNSYVNQEHSSSEAFEVLFRSGKLSMTNHRIGIFPLASSANLKSIENLVAQSIYDALLKKSVCSDHDCHFNICISERASLHIYDSQNSLDNIFEIAVARKYQDVIIIEVISASEGSSFSPSHIAAQVRIFNSRDKNRKLLFYAKIQEYGNPGLSNDFIFFRTQSRAAPSLATLTHKNAEIITNAICYGGRNDNNQN